MAVELMTTVGGEESLLLARFPRLGLKKESKK